MLKSSLLRTTKQTPTRGEVRPKVYSVVRQALLRAVLCLLCLLVVPSSRLLAQCATCRAGGHCAQSQGGNCMANRTFWGYYQGNWRKWPTVVAAEQAAAAEAAYNQSPSKDAPNAVLPKPVDEAREGNTPGVSSGSSTPGETTDTPDPTGETSSSKVRDRTRPTDPTGEAFPPFEATKPVLPENPPTRTKLPGSRLDDPAPVPPVDPNDSVPNLPPNLRNLEPPADEKLDLENLFKQPDDLPAPKSSGGTAAPPDNTASTANMTALERAAEHRRRLREHAERNRQYMVSSNANLKAPSKMTATERAAAAKLIDETPPSDNSQAPAAANVPSQAATLDELTALRRTEASATNISPRTIPAEANTTEEADDLSLPTDEPADDLPADDLPVDDLPVDSTPGEPAPLEVEEPELLLSPEDTTQAQNPLRENVAHARYAARMFTPQLRTDGAEEPLPPAGARRGAVNPLRSVQRASAVSPVNGLREVTPAAYEEEITPAAEALSTPLPEASPILEQAPLPVAEDAILQTNTAEPQREETAAPAVPQRKPQEAAASSGNLLREDVRGHRGSSANPLRGSLGERSAFEAEDRGASLPARSPGTGRYLATYAAPAAAELPAAASTVEQPTAAPQFSADRPAGEPRLLRTANPLRAGL